MKNLTLLITLLMTLLLVSIGYSQTAIFINELHYNNVGLDTNEGVEIAGPAGTDLTGWKLEGYNGTDGTSTGDLTLSGSIPNEGSSGYGAVWFDIDDIDDVNPGGVALINDSGVVVQFLSYGGSFTATSGAANGMTSIDIDTSEDDFTPSDQSLQLVGWGTVYEDFSGWTNPEDATRGSINTNQTFSTDPYISLLDAEPSGSTATIAPNELNQIELEFYISNFSIGEPGTATEADGYVEWHISNDTDGVTHDSGTLFDLNNQPIAIAPFEVGKTYILTAFLKDNSDAEQASYIITAEALGYIQVADIAALKADANANGLERYYEITGAVTFTYGDSFQNRKWFQDANPSGLYVGDFEGVIPNNAYDVGDQVTGLRGVTFDYNGFLGFEPIEDSGTVSGQTTINPVVITISDFNANPETYQSVVVGFENVTFTNGDGLATFSANQNYPFNDSNSNTTSVFTQFSGADYIGTIIPSGSISGVVGIADQSTLIPRSLADINVTLGVGNFNTEKLRVYPNPVTQDVLYIENSGNDKFNVEIYNMLGQKVLTSQANNTINVSELQTGQYLVKIYQNLSTTTEKIIIR